MRPPHALLLSAMAMVGTTGGTTDDGAGSAALLADGTPRRANAAVPHPPSAAGSWTVGTADAMTNVLRAPVPFTAASPARISLARNEFEGIQIVVTAGAANITGLRWEASTPDDAGLELSLRPLGYVHAGLSEGCPFNATANPLCTGSTPIDCGDGVCRKRAKFVCRGCSEMGPVFPTAVRWWPYPILDFVDTADVAHHTAQPLLLTAHALPTAQPGNYSVRVSLSDATGAQQSVDITVEVFDFTLPLTPSLPTFWGVSSRDNPSIWGPQASTEEFADRFADFLLDHRIPVSSLYGGVSDWTTGSYTPSKLQRLWSKGQRSFNLAAIEAPNLNATSNFTGFYSEVESAIALMDSAGIPRNATSVYVLDESSSEEDAAVLPVVSAEIKRRFGREVQVLTCGQNQWWLRTVGQPREQFPDVDIFLPPLAGHFLPGEGPVAGAVASFANTSNTTAADAARQAGQTLGLYTSGFPYGKDALNWALEYPAIRSRLLMGVAMHGGNSEAFLYFRVNKWSQYTKSPLPGAGGKGPLGADDVTPTLEVTGYASAAYGYDGLGQLILPGPTGALSTIHFENIRDGLEDHGYLALLSQLVRAGVERGVDVSSAQALLKVPSSIFEGFDPMPVPTRLGFSEDPGLLRGYRDRIGREVVRLQAALA